MATFEVQVEGITGVDIGASTNPKQAELTEFLKDGVLDVTNKWLAIRPKDAELFSRTTSSDSQGVDVGRSQILSVLREAGADGSSDGSTAWRVCNKMTAAFQSRVVDIDSLHYASKFNPVFVIDSNGLVNVYPVPSSNNGIKVFHINKTPVNGSSASLAHGHDDILYFHEDKVYLVVLYSSIKVLVAVMSNWTQEEEDLELSQSTLTHALSLKKQYNEVFGLEDLMAKAQKRKQAEQNKRLTKGRK